MRVSMRLLKVETSEICRRARAMRWERRTRTRCSPRLEMRWRRSTCCIHS